MRGNTSSHIDQIDDLWTVLDSSDLTAEFIETDFAVPIEETARQHAMKQQLQEQQRQRKMSSSQPETPVTQTPPNVSFQGVPQLTLPAMGTLSNQQVIGQIQPIRGVNIHLAGGQLVQQVPRTSISGQSIVTAQPVPRTSISGQSIVTAQPISNLNQNVINTSQTQVSGLPAGTVLSPPLQVIPIQPIGTSGGVTLPTNQVTGNLSFPQGTVLMPIQQGAVTRLQVPSAPGSQVISRVLHPKPGLIAVPTSVRQLVPPAAHQGSSAPTAPQSSLIRAPVVQRVTTPTRPPSVGRQIGRPPGAASFPRGTSSQINVPQVPQPSQQMVGAIPRSRKGPYGRRMPTVANITVPRVPNPRMAGMIRSPRGDPRQPPQRQPRPAHCNQPQTRQVLNIPQQVSGARLNVMQTVASSTTTLTLRPIAPAPISAHVGLRIPVPAQYVNQSIRLPAQVVSSLQAGGVIPARSSTSQPQSQGGMPSQVVMTTVSSGMRPVSSLPYNSKLTPPAAHSGSSIRSPLSSPLGSPVSLTTKKGDLEPLNLHIGQGNAVINVAPGDLDDLEPGEIRRVPVYTSDTQSTIIGIARNIPLQTHVSSHSAPIVTKALPRMKSEPPPLIKASDLPDEVLKQRGMMLKTVENRPNKVETKMNVVKTESVQAIIKKEPKEDPDVKMIVKEPNLNESKERDEKDEDFVYYKDTDTVPIEYDDSEFVWQDFLEETGATAAPPTAFTHVERSLTSGFVKGMKVEVPVKNDPGTYWVATLVMSCGPLLRVRYEGYGEDTSADFWCDLASSEIHSLGWCQKNNKILKPPQGVVNKCSDWSSYLSKMVADTPDEQLLENSKKEGSAPVDQIKVGMRIEIQLELSPNYAWLVKVIENIGGRLLLRYEGMETASRDFWLFYLNHRLHYIGWAEKKGYKYQAPQVVIAECGEDKWKRVLMKALTEQDGMYIPQHIFKDQMEITEHHFQRDWKLEAVHPKYRNQICPATVSRVVDKYYFIVEFEDFSQERTEEPVRICCHANSPGLFPVRWCSSEGIRLALPKGWNKPDFSWSDYLTDTNAEPAPDFAFTKEITDHEFKRGMKLEAVNPHQPHQICAATITRIIGSLMWIHLDSSNKVIANHILDVESHDIFPVGWCESNNYQLKPPRKRGVAKSRVAVVQPERSKPMTADEFRSATYSQIKAGEGGSSGWCPKIYFNHRCFSGPFLSKSRIAELPKCVGPGPVILVLKEVLSMLINVAYKSCRVLREIQIDDDTEINPSMHHQMLKAKYKGKSYRAQVEICKHKDQVDEFCRQTCIKLECCPYLFSPEFVDGNCPENCANFTKTKYTYGKKKIRKIGRPPGGHTNLEFQRKPGKRRKRKKIGIAPKKRTSLAETESVDGDWVKMEDSNGGNDDFIGELGPDGEPIRKKRKYTRHLPPPSDIKTRGAKLPNFNFKQRPRRKRIAPETIVKEIPESPPQVKEAPPSPEPTYKASTEDALVLDTNPLYWTVDEVLDFIKTTDCLNLAKMFKEQEIDGQALLLLNLPTIQEHMDLKLGPAVKLCHHVERVKLAFFKQYAD